MKVKISRVQGIILSFALVIALFLYMFFYIHSIFGTPRPIAFSQEAWENSPYDRTAMLDDLLEKYDFTSMTKDEVIDILGEERMSIGEESLRYETYGGWLKDEILHFSFDKNGKITGVGTAN